MVAATTFENDAEALAIANDLGYGLCAGVHSRDISRALGLEAGSVWINGWFIGGVERRLVPLRT